MGNYSDNSDSKKSAFAALDTQHLKHAADEAAAELEQRGVWTVKTAKSWITKKGRYAGRVGDRRIIDQAKSNSKLLEAGLTPQEIDERFESAYQSGQSAAETESVETTDTINFEYHGSNSPLAAVQWQRLDAFSDTSDRPIAAVLERHGVEYRGNLRSQRFEIQLNGEWRELNKWLAGDFLNLLRTGYSRQTSSGLAPLKYSKCDFDVALDSLASKSQCDPFLQWLDTLPEHDGINRLDTLLTDLFNGEQSGLTAWAGRYLFIGAIQRAHSPGCKLDEVPVLLGVGGIGKSSLVSLALPDRHRSQWFTDGVDLAADSKILAEATAGRVVCEIGEMRGSTRADYARMKQYLTATNDNSVRAAYAHAAESRPRRFIFCATTDNPRSLPNDPAGNRRFVIAQLGDTGSDIEAFYSDQIGGSTMREMLWAEGLARYEGGERANLPRELRADQRAVNEQHRSADTIFEGLLDEALADLQSLDCAWSGRRYVRMADLLESHILKPVKPTTWQIQTRLRSLGYEARKIKISGSGLNVWLEPAAAE